MFSANEKDIHLMINRSAEIDRVSTSNPIGRNYIIDRINLESYGLHCFQLLVRDHYWWSLAISGEEIFIIDGTR